MRIGIEKRAESAPEVATEAGFFRVLWDFVVVMLYACKWSCIETFTRHRKFDLQETPKRSSETAVITGGARGIGAEVVKKLMILDMHVIIGCRNQSAGVKMVDDIRKEGIQTGSVDVLTLDLNSLDSVREFSQVLLGRDQPINILINNAGIMFTPYQVTTNGFESQLQTNYLGHFLLTSLLLPLLTAAGTSNRASRIVNVSSCAHYGGQINFDDLNLSKSYSKYMAYMSSKLMQVISTKELDTRMTSQGVHVHAYSVHPGVVNTDLYDHIWWFSLFGCILKKFMKTPVQGADGVVFAALAPEIEAEGGSFVSNCRIYSPNPKVGDLELQKRLWTVSNDLVGLNSSNTKEFVDATTNLR